MEVMILMIGNCPSRVMLVVALLCGQLSVLSYLIFYINEALGMSFVAHSVKSYLSLPGYSYVDNCDLFQSSENLDEVLVSSMQHLINSWGSLMEVTGGALRRDKSGWYFVKCVSVGTG